MLTKLQIYVNSKYLKDKEMAKDKKIEMLKKNQKKDSIEDIPDIDIFSEIGKKACDMISTCTLKLSFLEIGKEMFTETQE